MQFELIAAGLAQAALAAAQPVRCAVYYSKECGALLEKGGLRLSGFEDWTGAPADERSAHWALWEVRDRVAAEAFIEPMLVVPDSLVCSLERTDSILARHARCPCCRSTDLHFVDGDTVELPLLPKGLESPGELDAMCWFGECAICQRACFQFEFAFSSVKEPDACEVFCATSLPQRPDEKALYIARAANQTPWFVERQIFDTGQLPRGAYEVDFYLPNGPFIVDIHRFGPFPLDEDLPTGSPSAFDFGEGLLLRLASSAAREVKRTAAAHSAAKSAPARQ
jgi:hypothetical protein